ncbi:MAG: histidine kinase [Planctomycetes bacterium]|nr:histidine kinase [Planctomycetota bacterium]
MPQAPLTSRPEHVEATVDARSQHLTYWQRDRIFWSFQVIFWLGIGAAVLGLSTALRPDEPTPWMPMVIRTVIGFTITSLLHLLFQQPFLRTLPRPQRWTIIVIVAAVAMMASLRLLMVLQIGGPTNWSGETTIGPIVPRLVAAGMWCAIYFGLEVLDDLHESQMEQSRVKVAASDVEIRALKAETLARQHEMRQLQEQLNPHFLFNALNAVMASKDDPTAVERVSQDLSDYLRFVLREARTLEPLSRELQALETYLAVQHARFGDNLVCRVVADRAAQGVLVPPMLIQPLLENALHYGAKTSSMPLKVNVRASVKDGVLEVVVANSGRWIPPDSTRSPSTGIRSLRKRLELLVGNAATVDTHLESEHDGGWVSIVVRLPANLTHTPPPALPAERT